MALRSSFFAACFCFFMVCSVQAELISIGDKGPSFTISDYNDIVLTSQQCAGKKVVLLFGGRKEGAEQADLKMAFDKALNDAKDVVVVSVGIVKAPAFIPRGLIKSGFKKETKGVQTFCDWGGKMAASYGVPDAPITAIVMNKEGIVVIVKQNFTKNDFDYVIKEINSK